MRYRTKGQYAFGLEQMDPRLKVGLRGAWLGRPGSGILIRDESGFNNHGTLTGGPTWTLAANDMYGVDYDGQTRYVTIPDHSSLNFTSSFTICAWVFQRANNTCNGVNNNCVAIGKITPGTNGYMIYQECTNNTWTFFAYGLTPTNVNFGVANVLNQWRHLLAQYDASNNQFRTYVNGVLTATQAVTGSPSPSANPLQFSKYTTNANYIASARMGGQMAWNRAITLSEIQELVAFR